MVARVGDVKTVAVIGSGISGLTAAWLLSQRYRVTLFEKDNRLGGHTHTQRVSTRTGEVDVDTGFIVHNRENYPGFCRLMAALGVDTCESDMSFAASGVALPWCSRGLSGAFTQRSHFLSPRFYAFWAEVIRFNLSAQRLLMKTSSENPSLGEFLRAHRFSEDFRENYLWPMAGAVWSTSPLDMDAFPARTMIQFFENHGMLGFTTQRPWRTIRGGTSRYIAPMVRAISGEVVTSAKEAYVRRTDKGVTVSVNGKGSAPFDDVVLAVHGDQVLSVLADPSELEREVFGAFGSHANPATLHTDVSVMPKQRRAWASWNYRPLDTRERLGLTYHMNRLQPLPTNDDVFVTLHAGHSVAADKVTSVTPYEHPRFDARAVEAQGKWALVSGAHSLHGRTHFAGAYWASGFHEDGVKSALRAAESLGVSWPP